MERPARRTMDVSSWWLQAVVLTFVLGFGILGYLAIRIYRESPPVPARVVSESGQTVFTRDDIRAGQESFLTYGLMQYGSVYGHGAYLGPDFTADYLHRSALEMRRAHGDSAEAAERVRQELRQNRYDPTTDVLTWTDAQAEAFNVLRRHYESEILNRPKVEVGSDRTPYRTPMYRARSWHSSRGPRGRPPQRAQASPIRTRTTGRPKMWLAIT